jgi:hypothetical protein
VGRLVDAGRGQGEPHAGERHYKDVAARPIAEQDYYSACGLAFQAAAGTAPGVQRGQGSALVGALHLIALRCPVLRASPG